MWLVCSIFIFCCHDITSSWEVRNLFWVLKFSHMTENNEIILSLDTFLSVGIKINTVCKKILVFGWGDLTCTNYQMYWVHQLFKQCQGRFSFTVKAKYLH